MEHHPSVQDPIVYYRGRFAGPGPDTDELRRLDRRDDLDLAESPAS